MDDRIYTSQQRMAAGLKPVHGTNFCYFGENISLYQMR